MRYILPAVQHNGELLISRAQRLKVGGAHVGVRTSPPTYRPLLLLWSVEFNRTLLHSHLGRLVVTKEPQHARH